MWKGCQNYHVKTLLNRHWNHTYSLIQNNVKISKSKGCQFDIEFTCRDYVKGVPELSCQKVATSTLKSHIKFVSKQCQNHQVKRVPIWHWTHTLTLCEIGVNSLCQTDVNRASIWHWHDIYFTYSFFVRVVNAEWVFNLTTPQNEFFIHLLYQ